MSEKEADQDLAQRVVDAMMAKDAFSQWLGVKILEVSPRQATISMRVRTEMVNGFGVSHGAIAYALADSALAFASNTHGRVTVSIENSINVTFPKYFISGLGGGGGERKQSPGVLSRDGQTEGRRDRRALSRHRVQDEGRLFLPDVGERGVNERRVYRRWRADSHR